MRRIILDQAVARATGESLEVVRRHGFSTEGSFDVDWDSDGEQLPQLLDWDDFDGKRPGLFP